MTPWTRHSSPSRPPSLHYFAWSYYSCYFFYLLFVLTPSDTSFPQTTAQSQRYHRLCEYPAEWHSTREAGYPRIILRLRAGKLLSHSEIDLSPQGRWYCPSLSTCSPRHRMLGKSAILIKAHDQQLRGLTLWIFKFQVWACIRELTGWKPRCLTVIFVVRRRAVLYSWTSATRWYQPPELHRL